MLKLTVTVEGKDDVALADTLCHIARQVEQGFLCGFDRGDGGSYHFDITGEAEKVEVGDDLDEATLEAVEGTEPASCAKCGEEDLMTFDWEAKKWICPNDKCGHRNDPIGPLPEQCLARR